jgi:hypothetical protein
MKYTGWRQKPQNDFNIQGYQDRVGAVDLEEVDVPRPVPQLGHKHGRCVWFCASAVESSQLEKAGVGPLAQLLGQLGVFLTWSDWLKSGSSQ